MITPIDSNRAEMLCEVRAKREMALRSARAGDCHEQEYWLAIVGRMTTWIEHLEMHDATRAVAPTQSKPAEKAVREKVGTL